MVGLCLFLFFCTLRLDFHLCQRCGVVDDLAVQYPDDTAGVFICQIRVVSNHNDQTVLGDLPQDIHDLQACLGIQRTGRLICQNDIGVIHNGTGDSYTLHLSAGHLVRSFMQLISQAHLLQGFLGALFPFVLGNTGERQRQLHIL